MTELEARDYINHVESCLSSMQYVHEELCSLVCMIQNENATYKDKLAREAEVQLFTLGTLLNSAQRELNKKED